jgi:hypothetical protein
MLDASEIRRNRRRTKMVVWSLLGLVFLGAIFALWQMLSSGRTWQALLVLGIAALIAWRSYRQATSASRR